MIPRLSHRMHGRRPLPHPQTHPGEGHRRPAVQHGAPQPVPDRGHGRAVAPPLPQGVQDQETGGDGDVAGDVHAVPGRAGGQAERHHGEHKAGAGQVAARQDHQAGVRGLGGETAQERGQETGGWHGFRNGLCRLVSVVLWKIIEFHCGGAWTTFFFHFRLILTVEEEEGKRHLLSSSNVPYIQVSVVNSSFVQKFYVKYNYSPLFDILKNDRVSWLFY